jgi:hypothetical protein
MLGLQAVQKITAFVFTRNSQALRFHLASINNSAQLVTTKVAFSNNVAPA